MKQELSQVMSAADQPSFIHDGMELEAVEHAHAAVARLRSEYLAL